MPQSSLHQRLNRIEREAAQTKQRLQYVLTRLLNLAQEHDILASHLSALLSLTGGTMPPLQGNPHPDAILLSEFRRRETLYHNGAAADTEGSPCRQHDLTMALLSMEVSMDSCDGGTVEP